MQQLGVPEDLVNEAAAIVMTTRPIFDPAQNGIVPAEPARDSLYARIGGGDAVKATVDVFYKRLLADVLLAPFFEGVDMVKQMAKQVRNEYSGVLWIPL
jgi:hypothetical protein